MSTRTENHFTATVLRTWFVVVVGAMALALASPPADAAKKKYKEIAVKNGGAVQGKLTFTGKLPEDAVEMILITKNPDVCGKGEREVVWIDVKDGALRSAFVFLDRVKAGKKMGQAERRNISDQSRKMPLPSLGPGCPARPRHDSQLRQRRAP